MTFGAVNFDYRAGRFHRKVDELVGGIMTHGIEMLGGSGIVFSLCGLVWGASRYANTTKDNQYVDCEKCIRILNERRERELSND